MRKLLGLACVVHIAGCGVVFGLERLNDVPSDAVKPRVQGRLWERYITNDTNFMSTVVERAYPSDVIALAVTLDDGTDAPVTYRDDGTFEFERARDDQLYRLVFTVDGVRSEFQLTNADIAIPRLIAGRPIQRQQAVNYLEFPYPAAVTDLLGAHVASTGLYSMTYTALYGPTIKFDWRTAGPTGSPRLGMLEANENDRVYVLEFRIDRTSFAPLAYQVITAASSASITQVVGQTHMLPAAASVARNGCARMTVANAQEVARIDGAVGRPHSYLGGDWHVFAAPAPSQVATLAHVTLAVAGQPTAIDSEIVATFHDPFPGWALLGQAGALAGFDTLLPGTTTPLRLYDLVRRYRVLERGPVGCTQPTRDMTTDIALAGDISIAGTPLVTDALSVALPDGDIEVTWKIAAEGTAHFASVTVHELIAAGAFTTNVVRRSVVATGTRAILERDLFVPGSTYIIAVTLQTGRPNAIDGDWSAVADPFDVASTWSRYFVVQ